ncbi:store-operated calcium entry regulator STIMATE-like [Anopheles ziemanni]|uniref:store-operated calcium entry regulator STIMATE-like n=1 Tax=Anopheles coustani TaxID=139045 RepID=UPI00265A1EA9|nr:store-operated calcium entry regulator STIMATE-like [Anopheles coustani]XP_058126134.1 store-operated calcium entry regulator STIMATE-like [Anopheles coustani]XP_058172422.1 store-operated calcium entry regulator STIMATE-like [Anopheles ziemanni]
MNTSAVVLEGLADPGTSLVAGEGNTEWQTLHCSKDALTDLFGWFLQGILATLAFTCLIAKRFCEPQYNRRSWETWWYDTSKQGIGALVIHMANVYLAPLFQGDPCTWYIINFLLDSTIGLFIIYIGIKTCQYLARKKKWDAINFGEYGAPKSWFYQTCIYVCLMVVVKLITTLIIQFDVWDNVKNFVLSPFKDPRIELAVVMLVIPFFVNILIFWVTDNFLMRHTRKKRATVASSSHHVHGREHSLLQKVKYKMIQKSKPNDSESDTLLSGDEEILSFSAPGNGNGGNGGGTHRSVMGRHYHLQHHHHHPTIADASSSLSATTAMHTGGTGGGASGGSSSLLTSIDMDTAIILSSSSRTSPATSRTTVQQRTSVINI